ncbi:MAG: IPT/TIG domain-containing protein [Xanthobacteraceae bacterium]
MTGARLFRIAGFVAVAFAALVAAGGQVFAACFSISPGSGVAGTTVSITAPSGLSGTTSVTFGGVAASILTVTDTQVQVTVPTEPTPSVSTITNESVFSLGFGTAVGPTSGGNLVQITGANFDPSVDVGVSGGSCTDTLSGGFTYNDVTTVTIGGSAATFNVVNSNTITATAPPGVPGVAAVLVVTTNTNSGTSGVGLYTYAVGGPSVTTIGPTFGLTTGGNTVTITGSNFIPGTLHSGAVATTVSIGGHAATNVVVSSTVSITATVPAGSAGAADVVVTTPVGNSGDQYLYLYESPLQPSIQLILNANSSSPYLGTSQGTTQGGDKVTITGSNFTGATAVTIGGAAVTSFSIDSPGQISTTTPTHAAGTVSASVTVPSASPTTGTGGSFTFVTPAPTVQVVSPNTGSTVGGTKVSIAGSNFTGATAVKFGTVAASSFTVTNDNSITATAPPSGSNSAVDITVTTPSGTSATSAADVFTYFTGTAPPTISSISPATGSTAGGTAVTITGTNLTGATSLTFGGNAATSVVVNAAGTQITAVTPSGSGTVNVAVTTPGGTATVTNGYTYTAAAPTVASVSPNSGPTQGGTLITIMGTFFSGQPQVTVGGVQASSVTLISSTQIQAVTPAGTGTKDVVVITSFGSSATSAADQFTYTTGSPPTPSAPTVTSVNPPSGTTAGGTAVTITGTNLTGATSVTFGSASATSIVVNAAGTQITAVTPPGTGLVSVAVTTPGGTVTAVNAYQYVTVAPTVMSIAPNTGTTTGGTAVTITGTNFAAGATVKIGGSAATGTIVVNPTTITATTPAGSAGPANVSVTVGSNTGTGTNLYTYVAQPAPTVTVISPNVGPTAGGTAVAITGTNFTGATAVTIGGTAATLVHVVSSTSITAVTPAGTADAANVVVTTPAGSSTGGTGLFTYDAAPTVTGVSPADGVPAGGYMVMISGTNFVAGATVKFGSTGATVNSVTSATSITVTVPPGTGTVDVTVTTPGGSSVITPSDHFTYAAVPTVTSIAPNAGPPSGGTVVTVTGTGFTGATAVMFGATSATTFTVTSPTSITATSPVGTGTTNITVTTPGGTSGTNPADQFSYGKAATSLTLTSSPNPSVYGQTVIFTATVTGRSPSGTVTFFQGSTRIGSALLSNITATSATATLAISTLPLGADPVTASYAGDANNAADPETITQYVNAPSDSIKLRELQVAAMPIVANLSSQAINSAVDNAIAAGFSGSCSNIPTPNGSGFAYCFDGSSQAQNGPTSAPQQARAKIDDDFATLGYADAPAGSPSAAPPNAAIASNLGPYGTRPVAAPYAPPREWLAWIDVRGTDFDRYSVGSDLVGMQVNAIAGLTHVFSPAFLVGVLAGYEHFDFTSQAYNGALTGQGATVGAYLGWRLTPSVRFTAGTAWSDIFAGATAGTATGDFTGHRWLAFGGLTGTFGWGDAVLEPSAQVYTLWEHENPYTDSLGTQQANHDFDTGRASSGLKIAYPIAAGSGTLAPYAGLYADYYFSMDNATVIGLTTVPIMQGWGARTTTGLTVSIPGGAQVSAGIEFSGIGNDTHIWTLTVRGSVPF